MKSPLFILCLSLWIPACHALLPLEQRSDPPGADGGKGEQSAPTDGIAREQAADLPDDDLPRADGPVKGDAGCSTTTLPITDDYDDGEIDIQLGFSDWLHQGEGAGGGSPAGLYIGAWGDGPTWAYFRFKIPGAVSGTVVSARLTLMGLHSVGWDSSKHALVVAAEDSLAPPQVTDKDDAPSVAMGRAVTKAEVRWPPLNGLDWKTVAAHPPGINQSPDLTPLIKELTTKHGGLAGKHIQLWIKADFLKGNSEVTTWDYGLDPNQSARLVIEWCP